jgi:hypothetical protein
MATPEWDRYWEYGYVLPEQYVEYTFRGAPGGRFGRRGGRDDEEELTLLAIEAFFNEVIK